MGAATIKNLGTGEVFELNDGMKIGRSDTCDIILTDNSVSRIHAFFTKENDAWYIHDNNSTNGVFLNHKRLPQGATDRLQNGVEIGIGKYPFAFMQEEELAGTTLLTPNEVGTSLLSDNPLEQPKTAAQSSGASHSERVKEKTKKRKSPLVWILPVAIGGTVLIAVGIFLLAYFMIFSRAHELQLSIRGVSMETGREQPVTYTILPERAASKAVHWESSDEAVATVSDDGTIQAHAVGNCVITGTVDSAKASIDVSVWRVTAIEAQTQELYLEAGEEQTIEYTVLPKEASGKVPVWSSTDESVATVDETGKVTAKGYGTCGIVATISDVSMTVPVHVYAEGIRKIAGTWDLRYFVDNKDNVDYYSKVYLVIEEDGTGVLRQNDESISVRFYHDADDETGTFYYGTLGSTTAVAFWYPEDESREEFFVIELLLSADHLFFIRNES